MAISDPNWSSFAADQLTEEFGYFRGLEGLLRENGFSVKYKHGGPILYEWMRELG